MTENIKTFVEENIDNLVKRFGENVSEVLLQQSFPLVNHIYISFMRSSILNNLPLFRCDFYENDILLSDEIYSVDFTDESVEAFLHELVPEPAPNKSISQQNKAVLNYQNELYSATVSLHEQMMLALGQHRIRGKSKAA